MAELYEVLYTVGEDENKKYVIAEDEADLEAYLAAQALSEMAYYRLAQDVEYSFVPGPTQLTKQTDGVWLET